MLGLILNLRPQIIPAIGPDYKKEVGGVVLVELQRHMVIPRTKREHVTVSKIFFLELIDFRHNAFLLCLLWTANSPFGAQRMEVDPVGTCRKH